MNRLDNVRTGLDRVRDGASPCLGARLGLIVHPASVDRMLRSTLEVFRDRGTWEVVALFGPQHGAGGEKQDNMIESASSVDRRTGLPVHSLYSETRSPTPDMLDGIDALVFDLQDVGVRVYTFVWTMVLAMQACRDAGVRFLVLDRPNPIAGGYEGPPLRPGFESFVGMHTIPLRHGLTCGELARLVNDEMAIGCDLEVVEMEGWRRSQWFDATGLPYVMPSPNLPTLDSCTVYPGMVLLEGTNLSEGRGTTRPFEIFGAPFLDGRDLVERLESRALPGVRFRPCTFEPTFQKHAEQLCEGAQIHVVDREAFRPVRTAISILECVRDLAPNEFAWRPPPYEYEYTLMPIDILFGSDRLRTVLDGGGNADEVLDGTSEELAAFERATALHRLYP